MRYVSGAFLLYTMLHLSSVW